MHFCPQPSPGPHALILDKIVAAWLGQHAGLGLNPVPWSPATYSRYLDAGWAWADELLVPAGVLEKLIFKDQRQGDL